MQQFEDVKASFYKQISDGTLEPTTGMNAIRQVESMQEQEQRAYVLKANDVVARGQAWLNANPNKRLSDNPELLEEAKAFSVSDNLAKYSVTRDRETDRPLYNSLTSYTTAQWKKTDADQFMYQYGDRLSNKDMQYFLGRISKAQNTTMPESAKDLAVDRLKVAFLDAGFKIGKNDTNKEHEDQ